MRFRRSFLQCFMYRNGMDSSQASRSECEEPKQMRSFFDGS